MAARREKFALEAIKIDATASTPMYRQLEEQLKLSILEGRLTPGEKLPSSRQLSHDLQVSRNTVKNAFHQLIAEGYLVTTVGSGTCVNDDLPEASQTPSDGSGKNAQTGAPLPRTSFSDNLAPFKNWMDTAAIRQTRPFVSHTPAIDMFPRNTWAKLSVKRARQISAGSLDRGDPRGYKPLRQAIVDYVGKARGFTCSEAQTLVTAGAQQALDLVAKLVIERGDIVCMEDPCYTPAKVLFELAGARVITIPVDEQGIDTRLLNQKVPEAKLIYVTPNSHFPLTMTMSLQRRLDLIAWARNSGATILEDDYNGEYRYSGRPLPALRSIVPPDIPAIYIGSFSKLLFPSLRCGYMILPPANVEDFTTVRWLSDRHSPILEQAIMADFIDEGHFARHVRRMRSLYAKRQAACVSAFQQHLGHVLTVAASDVGLHVIGWLRADVSEQQLLSAAKQANVDLAPLSIYYSKPPEKTGVIIGYAPYSEKQILRATLKLRAALEGSSAAD